LNPSVCLENSFEIRHQWRCKPQNSMVSQCTSDGIIKLRNTAKYVFLMETIKIHLCPIYDTMKYPVSGMCFFYGSIKSAWTVPNGPRSRMGWSIVFMKAQGARTIQQQQQFVVFKGTGAFLSLMPFFFQRKLHARRLWKMQPSNSALCPWRRPLSSGSTARPGFSSAYLARVTATTTQRTDGALSDDRAGLQVEGCEKHGTGKKSRSRKMCSALSN
jgi:hypothetical protein